MKFLHAITIKRFVFAGAGLAIVLCAQPVEAQTCSSSPVDVGYRDFNYGATVHQSPSASKPESKLWWNDGYWWGSLWDPASNKFRIHRFNLATQCWVNAGPDIDSRPASFSDALWDGQRLYIVSHVLTTTGTNPSPLYRYSYNSATDTYTLDAGFPVNVNQTGSQTLVLAKDATGKLWVTWTQNGKVKVNRSVGNDLTWGQPFDLPVQGGLADLDDISSIVTIGNSGVGIMWSNQVDKKIYFTAHLNGNDDTTWEPREEALADANLGAVADDHINLKYHFNGNVYAAIKTSLLGADAPLIYVLKRDPNGIWSRHLFGTGADQHSRPILLIDEEHEKLYVFAMVFTNPQKIYMKSTDLNNIQFPSGRGTIFIHSATDNEVNDPTSTKQNLNSATGLLVLASEKSSRYYFHNYLDLSQGAPNISSFTPTSGVTGTVVTITGSNFTGATGVTFNGTAATSFVVASSTQLRATVPAGATTGKIRVTTAAGSALSTGDFTVTNSPPTITSFTPASGSAGTQVTIAGTNFTGTTGVTFNGTSATSFTVDSGTQIRATVPTGATTGKIGVTTLAGSTLSATNFTVASPPSITFFSPTSGPVGVVVTITGNNFNGTTAVTFNGVAAASFNVDSNTQIRATVPTGATTGKIRVTNAGGSALSSSNFNVILPPSITDFTPTSGSAGTQVTITGTNFIGTTSVSFNGTSATFILDSGTQIRATVPTGATSGKIGVTNSAGTGLSANNFTVNASPSISSFSPTGGEIGTAVTITGAHFIGASSVTFNGATATFTVDSDTQIRATVPTGATTGKIGVTNAVGSALSVNDFTVTPPPSITSFAPASGSVGTAVTITGSHFTGATSVTFNGTAASFTVDSDTQIRANVPTGATTGKIGVTNAAGTTLSTNDFIVTALPVIASFTPSDGPVGREVTITGTNFTGATSVTFNGTSTASFTVDSGTQIRATVPAGASTGKITITNAVGSGFSATNFVVTAPPAITSFAPMSGPVGTEVTITGTNFTGTSSVTFNGVSASFVVDSNTKIRATVPAGLPQGESKIGVVNSAGNALSTDNFTVTVPPSITSFTPANGLVGSEVTMTGANFTGATSVTFNGTLASFVVDSATQLRATVPAGATSGKLGVTNAVGTGLSATDFVVILLPTITSFAPTSGPVGTEVTITGTNFTGTSSVTFNGTSASFVLDAATQLRAAVPASATSGKMGVTNPAGSVLSAVDFTVTEPPTSFTFAPLHDTYVRFATPASRFGTTINLRLRENGTDTLNTYLKFAVTGLSATVQSAKLRLYCTNGSNSGGAVYSVSNNYAGTATPWTENGLNWSNAPVIGGAALSTLGGVSAEIWVELDVTAAITGNGTYSFGLKNTSTDVVYYSSKEGDHPPELVIQLGASPPSAPTITSFMPTSGAVGVEVTMTGANFTSAASVTFNGTSASFVLDSETQLRATVPAGATSGKIEVTNAAGAGLSATDFVVILPPTITSFTPTSGPVGTEVTVAGTNFTGATSVKFNGASASFVLDSAIQLHATVPAGATSGKLEVSNPAGSVLSAADFGVTAPATSFTFTPVHDTYIRFSTPASTFGSTLTLRQRQNGTDTLNTYLKFEVTGLSGTVQSAKLRLYSTDGSNSAGSVYVVSNYYAGTTTPWTEGGLNWSNAPVIAGTALSTLAGVGVGIWVELEVTAAVSGNGTYSFGLKNASTDAVYYSSKEGEHAPELVLQLGASPPPAPVISSFTPTSGAVGEEVTIAGANLSSTAQVAFNGVNAPNYVVDSATQIRANVPAGATSGKLGVTTGGGTALSTEDFTVILPPAITTFTPTSGPAETEVTVTGANFTGATSVTFNGTSASFVLDSATQIRATVPVGATSGKIGVTTSAGSALSATDFTVSGLPQIFSFTPMHDAYVRFAAPTNSYGAVTTLRLRANADDTIISYVKFNVTGLSGPVLSAKLRLYVTLASSDGGAVYAVSNDFLGTTSAWLENGLKWINAPTLSGAPLSAVGAVNVDTWVEFDVTSAISGDGIYSFGLKNNSSDLVYYSSKEGTNKPELVIQTGSSTIVSSKSAVIDGMLALSGGALPEQFSLSPNYPNPFNGQTVIEYALPQPAKVRLVIYDALGHLIRTLVDATQPAGYHRAMWDGKNDSGVRVSSGMYFYQLETGLQKFARKMILQQ